MRQTIDCLDCSPPPKTHTYNRYRREIVNNRHDSETTGFYYGYPAQLEMRCDACGNLLGEHQLVVAIGTWNDKRGMPNIHDWHLEYITPATSEDMLRYIQAEKSAKEIRDDGQR